MVVTPASRSDAGEIGKGVLMFLDQGFREARVSFKRPDKFRAEGKAKGVDVVYVLNGNKKQITAPALMLKKTDNLSDDREKKQSTLDVGFASDLLWKENSVKLLSTDAKGVAKLQLVPLGTTDKRREFVWIDTKSLKVLKRERYGGGGNLKARYIYANHKMMRKMPVATLLKAYSPDGGYAGSISYKDVRANTGLSDSLFAIK
jgi:outer membrane lipoprotein-sorting protein